MHITQMCSFKGILFPDSYMFDSQKKYFKIATAFRDQSHLIRAEKFRSRLTGALNHSQWAAG